MQGNVGTTPGVRGWRQVISIGFTADFENCNSNAFRDLRAAGEPLAICPALQDFLSMRIALIGLFLDIMKGIKHQKGVFESLGRGRSQRLIIPTSYQWSDHKATQL